MCTEETPVSAISETIIVDTNESAVKPTAVTVPKTKNIRKTIPIPSTTEEKKVKIDPEDGIRYG